MKRSIQIVMLCWIFGGVGGVGASEYMDRDRFTKADPLVFAPGDMVMLDATSQRFGRLDRQAVTCYAKGLRRHIVCNPDTIRSGGFKYAIKYKLDGSCYDGADKSKLNVKNCVLIVSSRWVPDFLSGVVLTLIMIGVMSCFACGLSDKHPPPSNSAVPGLLWVLVGSVLLGAADGATDNDSYAE